MVIKATQTPEGILQGDQSRARDMMTVDTETDQLSLLRLEHENEQLLPGITDEITLRHVVPKLPWRVFNILVSVSRSWRQAVRSGAVYDARIRASATETLVAILVGANEYDRNLVQIALYSMNDKCCYQLPPFPEFGRIPRACQFAILDGKIYVLGGKVHKYDSWSEVWVFDLVGQTGWKKCANMHDSRSHFACAVKDGKIFVFGGGHCCSSEVYDPEEDMWLLLTPISSQRTGHRAARVGEELIVYGGYLSSLDLDVFEFPITSLEPGVFEYPITLEVYDPAADDWRVRDAGREFSELAVFRAQGKFYWVTEDCIFVYDDDENTWSHRYLNSFRTLGLEDYFAVATIDGLAFNDEVILAVEVLYERPGSHAMSYLLQSKAFGSCVDTIEWQIENFSLYFGGSSWTSALIGLIQL
ncbi:unnamed protein product [Calypogeia fissa]